jgi:hypothetical protein
MSSFSPVGRRRGERVGRNFKKQRSDTGIVQESIRVRFPASGVSPHGYTRTAASARVFPFRRDQRSQQTRESPRKSGSIVRSGGGSANRFGQRTGRNPTSSKCGYSWELEINDPNKNIFLAIRFDCCSIAGDRDSLGGETRSGILVFTITDAHASARSSTVT